MALNLSEKLDIYADLGYNVLLIGDSGVGKTALIEQVFNKKFGSNWKYFNGATMNPWVDFVGVPDRTHDNDTGKTYLTMVQKREFANDEVQAIFMDELNRAKEKTRNAVMELIQFGRINGQKFNNLKLIWVAINEGDEYDVERLDKATKDRFQVHIKVPYKPDNTFFNSKYGSIGNKAITWWSQLDENSKKMVSPRRLEYAIVQFNHKLPMEDVLSDIGVKGSRNFNNFLESEDSFAKSEAVYKKGERGKAKKLISDNVFFNSVFMSGNVNQVMIDKHGDDWLDFWVPLFSDESFVRVMQNSKAIRSYVFKNVMKERYHKILFDYYKINNAEHKKNDDMDILCRAIEEQTRLNSEFRDYIYNN